jgi:CheY-like chemotaxis protein
LEITIAGNGLEAFEKRKNGDYDVIFMDIQMPVLDGIEATQEILDFEEDYGQHHIPIIALTANALKGDRERFLAAGMDEYTTKPLVRSEIISLLNNFLSHKIIDIKSVPKSATEIAAASEETVSTAIETTEPEMTQTFPDANEAFDATSTDETVPETADVAEADTLSQNTRTEPELPAEPPRRSVYDADIVIAKQNLLEMKLFARILDDLGYTYKSVNTVDELKDEIAQRHYKLALFDKTLSGLNLKNLYDIIRSNNSDISLVMLIDPNASEEAEDAMYVHEIIRNIINKDLLRLVFEKFI